MNVCACAILCTHCQVYTPLNVFYSIGSSLAFNPNKQTRHTEIPHQDNRKYVYLFIWGCQCGFSKNTKVPKKPYRTSSSQISGPRGNSSKVERKVIYMNDSALWVGSFRWTARANSHKREFFFLSFRFLFSLSFFFLLFHFNFDLNKNTSRIKHIIFDIWVIRSVNGEICFPSQLCLVPETFWEQS